MRYDNVDDSRLEEVRSPVESSEKVMGREDWELDSLRRRLLYPIRTGDDDNALRRVRILEEAYDAAYALAHSLRSTLRGYRPDPALVISALVMYAVWLPEAPVIVQQYLQGAFNSCRDRESVGDAGTQSCVMG
jgi:hypothetical protein